MPFINIATSVQQIPVGEIERIQQETAQCVSTSLNKSIDYVMTRLSFGDHMSFAGDSRRASAYVEVKNIGELSPESTSMISQQICKTLEGRLGIEPSRVYIEFQESVRHLWGWDGRTFAG